MPLADANGNAKRPEVATPSNIITIGRILLVPVFVAALLAPWPEWIGIASWFSNGWKSLIAAAIFILISMTDWLDGYLARSRGEVTDFGKFMDPLADKILVTAALICLVELGDLPTWVVLVILAREFIVSGVRMMAASRGEVIAASMVGKFKTVFQMIAIVLFTVKSSSFIESVGGDLPALLYWLSWLVMLVALGLTIASMVDYLVKARSYIGFPAKGKQAVVLVSDSELTSVAEQVVQRAVETGATLACAESLTGGLIGAAISSVPGSSAVFKGGVISYVDELKAGLLGVAPQVLEECGAVSGQVAEQMARGARSCVGADIAIAVTGLAGPSGDDYGNPVGTVWIGFSTAADSGAYRMMFSGNRSSIRRQTVICALERVRELLA